MHNKESLIPLSLGIAITATGLIAKKHLSTELSCGLVGFGLAHILLGTIEYNNHKNFDSKNTLYTFSG